MKHLILYIITFTLLLSFASGATTYDNLGSNNSQFQLGQGIFSTVDQFNFPFFSASLSNAREHITVTDLDSDGTNEIIVIDADNVKVFEGRQLNFVSSYDMGSDGFTSAPIVFDIDGDGFNEYIVMHETDEQMHILNFSNGVITNQSNINIVSLADYINGQTMIACQGVQECMMVYSERVTDGTNDIRAIFFNETELGSTLLLDTVTGGAFCTSSVPYINVVDYDKDSTVEYVFSVGEITISAGSDQGVHIYYLSRGSGTSLVLDDDLFIDLADESGAFDADGAFACTDGFEEVFTSPFLNENILTSVGFETLIGFQSSPTEFHMELYNKDLDKEDEFPEFDDSNGVIISNIFKADTSVKNGNTDEYCIVGFDSVQNNQLVTCAQLGVGFFTPSTQEFRYTVPDYNVSTNFDLINTVAHAVQHSNAQTSGQNLHEVLNTYGIIQLDAGTCSTNPILARDICDAERIFQNSAGQGNVISVDLEKLNNEDLMIMTDNALFYFDDGISNQPIKSFTANYNPCPFDSVIKQNVSLKITLTAQDGNSDFFLTNDLLDYTATVYKGTSNEQVQQVFNATSGAPQQLFFPLNKTIASGIIELKVTDNVNSPITKTQTFSVGVTGLVENDATCTDTIISPINLTTTTGLTGNATTTEDAIDNIGVNFANSFNSFGLAGTTFWIILMVIGTLMILLAKDFISGQANAPDALFAGGQSGFLARFVGAIFFNMLMIVLGFRFGLFGIGTILFLTVTGGLAIGFWIRKQIAGNVNA